MSLPIHIAFCMSEDYFQYAAVCIRSIIENNSVADLSFHIFTDTISHKNKRRIKAEVASFKNVSFEILCVDDQLLANLNCGRWTKFTWYRVLLPLVLSANIHRVLYLDTDTLVVGDIMPLFSIDMEGEAVAGCLGAENFLPETFRRCGYDSDLRYICAGVLLMNLDYWRENHLTEAVIQWGKENNYRVKYPDQDSINFICKESKIVLPMKYGVIGQFFNLEVLFKPPFRDELKECLLHPVIIHFANQNPWKIELSVHPLREEWHHYNRKLRRPARCHYITKGWPFIKMIIWKCLHPSTYKAVPTKKDIIKSCFPMTFYDG
jgi:lipopolysaccharide biosynthesis glycosyltransferase